MANVLQSHKLENVAVFVLPFVSVFDPFHVLADQKGFLVKIQMIIYELQIKYCSFPTHQNMCKLQSSTPF